GAEQGGAVVRVAARVATADGDGAAAQGGGRRRGGVGQAVQEVQEVVGVLAGDVEADGEGGVGVAAGQQLQALAQPGVAVGGLGEGQLGTGGVQGGGKEGGVGAGTEGGDAGGGRGGGTSRAGGDVVRHRRHKASGTGEQTKAQPRGPPRRRAVRKLVMRGQRLET